MSVTESIPANPYLAALQNVVHDWGVIDGHHDLRHDGNDWHGDDPSEALDMIKGYCPGIPDDEQRMLANDYATGYGFSREDAVDEDLLPRFLTVDD